jgi:hypothetical protein
MVRNKKRNEKIMAILTGIVIVALVVLIIVTLIIGDVP